jgi:hypothetical protein
MKEIGCGLKSFGSTYSSEAGCCEHSNYISGSIKGGEFLNRLSDCYLLKKDSMELVSVVPNLFSYSQFSCSRQCEAQHAIQMARQRFPKYSGPDYSC